MGLIFWLWLIGIIYYSYRSLKREWGHARQSQFEADEGPEVHRDGSEEVTWPEETEWVDTIQDPVCGAYVSEKMAVQRRMHGITYFFCCQSCADRFEQRLENAI
jgi:YHS domain-containing protein